MAEKFTLSILVELQDKLSAPLTDMQEQLVSFGDKMKQIGKEISDVGVGLTQKLTLPLLAIGGVAIKTAADFEKLTVSFETLLGSADDAQQLLQKIEDFSAATPFQLPALAEGSKQLLAFGSRAEDVIDQLRMLGNAAAGDQEQMNRLVRAFGLVQARGRASMRELNMFIQAGVPIMKALGDEFGVSQEKLQEMISAGKISFEELNAALISLTTGTGQFAGLIEKQSKTLSGIFSTLQDNLGLLGKEIADIFLPQLKELTQTVLDIVKWFRGLDEGTKSLIGTLALIGAAIGPVLFIFGKLLSVFGSVVAWIPKIISGITMLNTAIGGLLGPIGLAIAGLTTLIMVSESLRATDQIRMIGISLQKAHDEGKNLAIEVEKIAKWSGKTREEVVTILSENKSLLSVYEKQTKELEAQTIEQARTILLRLGYSIEFIDEITQKYLGTWKEVQKETEEGTETIINNNNIINEQYEKQIESLINNNNIINEQYEKQIESLERIKRIQKEKVFRDIIKETGLRFISAQDFQSRFNQTQQSPVTTQEPQKQETEITIKVVSDKDTQATVEDVKTKTSDGRVPSPFHVNVFNDSYIGMNAAL
jgi:tape measure domain-containing protein